MASNQNTAWYFFWDKLVLPVVILVLCFMATWVFSINTDMAIVKKSMERVDSLVIDQRTAEKMMVLLESQTKANTELVQELKNSQVQMADAIVEFRITLARMNAPDSKQERR